LDRNKPKKEKDQTMERSLGTNKKMSTNWEPRNTEGSNFGRRGETRLGGCDLGEEQGKISGLAHKRRS